MTQFHSKTRLLTPTKSRLVKRRTSTTPSTWNRVALRYRVWLLALGHLVIFSVSYWLAFGLRFDFAIPNAMATRMLASLPTVALVKMIVFYFMGHYHGWWRYVTFADLASLLRASLLSLLVLVLINHYVFAGQIPRVVVVLDCLMTALLLGALRASWRLCREHWIFGSGKHRPAIMVGADHQSGVLAHQIHSNPDSSYRIVGFVDDDARRNGTRLGGIPILGQPEHIHGIALSCCAKDILVVANSMSGDRLRQLMDSCDKANLKLKVIPTFADQLSASGREIPIRDVEINDILHRDPIELDMQSISKDIFNKDVLVTGAGGSIGSELCRQLLQFRPRNLIVVDNGENSLFLLNREMSELTQETRIHPHVVDVKNQTRMRNVFQQHHPQYVFHAAAHKHVGLMESNVAQCVENNVFGTKCTADLANEFGVKKFVLISTDKAVNPTSVMGASKHIAERYVHALAQDSETAFVAVRFGNVLGSNGSVVPIFKEQIRKGGPITITDERMTRFFMTIPEASQLVLQAASMGTGGEIFVLEMGQQIPVINLARDLIRLSGLRSDAIEIRHVGMRPGEKLFEELYFDDERTIETSHPLVHAAYHRTHGSREVRRAIEELRQSVNGTDTDVRIKLRELVPEYCPPGKSLPRLSTDAVIHQADEMVG
jgi:FlaA1/EpsC-like NDP-sugar epimerase